ncbi:hypothetical protein IFT54_05510 [Sphingomonas sp. CFBP 13714]|uniref:hypothetical protein n=1 Tax=Sphingomonas sp. CFBP 13714 TaxID=2775308 RepID=UPI0017847275|nr:hypothetical protein [Sphingomonas sp. CFBP 13714]MBD8699272.1 hypothetical protein [Sphingomonas sp. CFBP 13714]
MAAVFVAPLPFTALAANEQATAPLSNTRNDEPGFVWRSANLTTVYAKVQLTGAVTEWDTFALVGSNLRATDTIRVRAGATAAAVDGTSGLTVDQTFNAWTGVAPTGGALSFKLLGAVVASPFVRMDITSTGNPATYVQAQRIVIGKRVETDGVNVGAEITFDDSSIVETGPGYTSVDIYNVRIGWKVTLDFITDAKFFTNWFPFLRRVGTFQPFVFIPDTDSLYVQSQAVFARVTSSAKGSLPGTDANTVEINVLSTS